MGVEGFGIGAFLSLHNFLREQIPDGVTQQSLFPASVILEFPGNAIQIFRNPVIAEGYPNLQAGEHTHPVFSIQQGLHEPSEIQIHHFLHSDLCRRILRQDVALAAGFQIGIHHVVFRRTKFGKPAGHQFGPLGRCLGPGKARLRPHLRVPVPGIAAENLVRALPGKGDLDLPSDFPAEGQQGKIHIRHSRQIPGNSGIFQFPRQVLRSKDGPMVGRMNGGAHHFNIGVIRIWLELSRLEIPVIIQIVH